MSLRESLGGIYASLSDGQAHVACFIFIEKSATTSSSSKYLDFSSEVSNNWFLIIEIGTWHRCCLLNVTQPIYRQSEARHIAGAPLYIAPYRLADETGTVKGVFQ